MKKIFFLFLLCNFATAQKLSQIELLSAISDDICNDFAKNNEIVQNERTLGLYMLKSINSHIEDVEFYYGEGNKDRESIMFNIGEEVGFHLGLKCPEIFEKIFSEEAGIEILTITGKFSKINNNQFLTFIIKEDSGKSHEFLLLNNFENAYLLTDKLLKPNEKLQVSYYISELYDAKIKKYVNYKIVTSIEKI